MAGPQSSFMDLHEYGLTVVWCILCDFSIFFAIYKYKKYAFYLHALLGILSIGISLGFILPILIPYGMNVGYGEKGLRMIIHAWIGLAFIIIFGFQVVSGLAARICQEKANVKSINVKKIKNYHTAIGYIIFIFSKINLLTGWYGSKGIPKPLFYVVLFGDLAVAAIYFLRKLLFPTLEQKTEDPQIDSQDIPHLHPSQLVYLNHSYVIFSNHVYNIDILRTSHPAGYQVIEIIKGREIDRFLYGMYSAEMLPQLAPHSHSYKALTLVGKPVGRLQIQIPYKSSIPDHFEVKIGNLTKFSETSFYVDLVPLQDKQDIIFSGYSDVSQLGQYYSLTVNKKITRLYSCVHLFHPSNMSLMSQLFERNFPSKVSNAYSLLSEQNMSEPLNPQQKGNLIPLIMKRYDNGKLTAKMLRQNWTGKMSLSKPKGLGLHFGSLKPGKVVICTGGTGINPFLDLIDLLYKQHLIESHHALSNQILKLNPILQSNPFKGYSFLLFASFRSLEDLPTLTSLQLSVLCQKKEMFRAIIRFDDDSHLKVNKNSQIEYTSKFFDEILIKEMDFIPSKVMICGPPIMNCNLPKVLLANGYKKDSFILI